MRSIWARGLHATSLAALFLMALTGCGGGEPEAAEPAATTEPAGDAGERSSISASPTSMSDSQRIAAATATAQSLTNDCPKAAPFYWEIGTRDAKKAGGSVGSGVTASTVVRYASASKWLYGAYVVQRRQGVLSSTDVQMLTMKSGYTNFRICKPYHTVDSCLSKGVNGQYSAATDGHFYYDGGHMQKHASMNGLGAKNNAGLTAALSTQLGNDVVVNFSQPQLAGGGVGNADTYARFLRKLLGGELRLGSMLGSSSVCTNPLTCGSDQPLYTPMPEEESWLYSLGHWVEADPLVGDGAFSSLGVYGFYPWIDAGRSYYGILARDIAPNGARRSALCGRQIRKAWSTGEAQHTPAIAPAELEGASVSTRNR
jgi:CubicO group peptidase (beta-lactamase class C family)